ncbi:LapD/MoxY N-terminal periplasmic domain-containing protein [Methylophaga sp.]|uniref:bifunctional diguanylate cyclase/phosphodiesterase n=1 Tax=Methylophaga sp. TaxID=2024840 RepID=UPI0013FFEA1F|nr:LapD/MoxY N-terminal periplasmic domain-containing protein [Methylophaga sp.]MTI63852.1 EAL domain-containing protein [Methylophaga sp.]
MSLSKQLLILISLIFLIVFSVSFYLSMNNIRNYLEVESEVHVQDTATSLGLSLSPHMHDEQDPILLTMMNAIFDMGYYKEMRLENVDGENLVTLTNPVQMEGVPDWLIKLLPMKTATARTEISSGWNISGTLYVTSNPAYAYLKLYEQAKETLFYSLLIFIAAFLLLMLVLRLTLQPLKAIQRQANEISSGNFTTISKLPWTTEVRHVANSMNGMSRKIGDTIARLNNRLDSLSDSLKRDPLTRLLNQATFSVDVKSALSAGSKGYVLYFKFDDLATISKELGNQKVDKLLQSFAELLRKNAPENADAYRLYGSEFALISPQTDVNSVTALAEQLKHDINELGQHFELEDMMHTGIVYFDKTSEFDRLMPALIEAYEQARNIGQNAFFIKQDSISSMNEQAWREAIVNAIDNNTPEITFTAEAYNYNAEVPVKVMQEAFTVVRDETGTPLSIGTFFSVAQEFDLAEDLDKLIVNKIILKMEADKITTPVTINLSMPSISSLGFQRWLKARLEQSSLSSHLLAFSVTAYAAAKDIAAFDSFSSFVKSLGATVLLKRYSSDIIPVDMLRELHIDYIRLARDLTHNIRGNASKPDFLELIQEVSSLIEIKVLAESVEADEDFEIVKQAGLFGISR